MIHDLKPKDVVVEPGTKQPQPKDTWAFLKEVDEAKRKVIEKEENS